MKKQLLLILLMVISPFAVFAETWTDVTHLFMQNSDFTGNKRTGWTRNISAEALNVNFECMEVFNGTFDVYQTLIGLPKGHYRLSVQAFYRAGSNDVAYWNRQDGTENLSAVIYADNKEQKVKSIYECVYSGTADDLWTPDNSSYYPNWMNSASIQFANGKYVNVVEFESDGTTRIGIRNDNHIESNWCIFDNFKLEYNGVINEADYHWTDVTGFLTNPKFDNNRKFGWTRNYSGDGVTSIVQYDCMEVWNGICDINQTLTGLPKGKYRLSAQAFFRESNSRDSYNNRQSGKDNITAVLYAGQSEQTIESVYDYSFTTNVSDTCWTPDQTVFYPNGMASTRVAFDEGAYMNTLDFEADGDIQIGIRNQNYIGNNWVIFDNFHLDYLGNITPVSDISLNISKTTLEEGESITATASVIPSNATIKNLTWFSSDPFILNVNQKGEITAFSAGTATLIVMTNDGGVRKEVSITVIKKDISDNREWTEMSYVINNGNFDTNGNNEGWTIENDGNTAVRAGSLEFWNNTYFRTSQVIENIPKGHYRLSVQGYHRYGNAAADYERLIDNEQTSLAYLFVDGHRKTLVPYCSYSEQTRPSDEWISPDNGKHWMPNTMESASEAFAKDAYWNYLEFDVEKTVEDVTIGIGLDEYTKENWCIFTNFKLETNIDIDLGKTYTLSVLDESGNDLSSKVTVHWYDGQGNELGSGKSIGGIKKDTELYYSVLLDESLGKQYREVTKQKASLEEATIVCQLQRIEEVTLHGKVSAYGTPLPRAEVNLTQWLNGKYEYTVKTLTDANGEFTLNAYNDSTELIVLANGYIDNKIVRRNLNNGEELGTIEMNEVQGKVIALNLSYQEATKEGVEPIIQNWYSDTRNIGYIVQNLTKGTEITDYAIQQGNIVLPTGIDRGDRIQITVSSLNEKFTEVTAEGIIADNDTANVDITLLAFGGIEAVYSQKADDNLLAMLYDSTGKLQMRTVCSSSRLTFTNLAAGTYSLVTMGYNGAIGSVADLSDLASMDLYEGADYVLGSATVRDGYIASVNVASVPELDASKFEYTGTNTSYMPNKTQLVAGNFITLTARLDFKEQYAGKTDNAKVVVEIPEGCEFVPNSVVIGAKPIPHSLNGNRLTITVDKEDLNRRIRFCVIPTETGTYMTTAYAEFDYKGTKTQPMGQIKFESTSGELYVPSVTKTSTITLGGIGVPKADVEVYDNNALIGTTKSLGNGKWSLKCELKNAYNLTTHEIYVKYRGESNVVGVTGAKECFYDINAIVPKTVTMINTAHPAGNLTPTVYETVFNYETVMAIKNYYLYWPEYPEFTFLIDLTENDTTKVSDVVLYVHMTDGDKRKLPAVYDSKKNRFVATGSFDMYSLPVNVCLNFSSKTKELADRVQLDEKMSELYESYENERRVLKKINSSFENIENQEGEETIYNLYLELVEKGDYDNIELKNYYEQLLNSNLSGDITDISILDSEYERLLAYKDSLLATYCTDSVYAVFGYSKASLDVELPEAPYSKEYVFDGNARLFQIESIEGVSEEQLISQGYEVIETTSGTKVFCLFEGDNMIFVDCERNLKYVTSKSAINGARGRAASNNYLDYLDATMPFAPSFISMVNEVNRLFNTDTFDQQELRMRIKMLELIIELVDDTYKKMFQWTNNRIIDYYSKFRDIANKTEDLLEMLSKEYDKNYANVIERSVVGSGSPELAKILKKQISICKMRNVLHALSVNVESLYQAYEKSKLNLPKSCKFAKGTKIVGKILGGLGILVQLGSFYQDIVEARDLYEDWVCLLDAIDKKIPCEYNPEGALKLQNDIRNSAKSLSYNIDRVLKADLDAIKIDCVSFIVEITGLFTGPGALFAEGAGVTLGFVAAIPSIYAEWSKAFSINGKFLRQEVEYWWKIRNLICSCPQPPCNSDNDNNSDKNPETDPVTPNLDPSGFVYEAVPTNRVKGVKATVYFDNDELPVLWNAAEFGQINPQITEEDGLYAWDVPQGMWKVIFEKAGYETTQTDWLPVPPPQLEINIPMSQAVAPYVEEAMGMESGITLSFSKYMKPNTLTKSNRVSVTCNGKNVGGDVEFLNMEENPFNKEEYASKIKFVPNTAFTTSDEVIITVKKEVESYANKQMAEDFVQRVKIESEINEIACDSVMAVDYHGTGVLELSVLPAAAAKGRTIQVASTSSMIASTDAQSVTLNDEGKARIVVSGELPGSTSLHLSMPDADKEKYVAVSVVTREEQVVKTPKASKLSGSTMEDSYLLTLTCATKGATIYYTIDGSCPCDEQTRKKYTGPITLPEGQITLQAVAVREGMVDSDIAEFTYTVIKDEANGIRLIEESHDFEALYQGGSIVISGAKGASCHIYDIQGRELASRNKISNQTRINVPKTDVYIVSVCFNGEQTVVHKIMAK